MSLKRKRSEAHESSPQQNDDLFQRSLSDIVNVLRKYDSTPSIFTVTLPSTQKEEPQSKRARLSNDQENESIQGRVSAGVYTTLESFVKDVNAAKTTLLEDVARNGAHKDNKIRESLEQIGRLVYKYVFQEQSLGKEDVKRQIAQDEQKASEESKSPQVLSLRSQTESGRPQQLYSGLQKRKPEDDLFATIDGKRLPNGFELTEATSTVPSAQDSETQKVRTFAEVFPAGRKVKTLEMPRSSRSTTRGLSLSFQPTSDVLFNIGAANKSDYRFAKLPAGSWVSHTSTDRKKPQNSIDSLYQQAYSSFAPTSDNANSVVSEYDRNQLWWQKTGNWKLSSILDTYPDQDVASDIEEKENADEFAEVIANFAPTESDSKDDESEDLLNEVSELLETLSSYQRLRSVETPRNLKPVPSSEEVDVYEILRSQLALLVGQLPPFAVAKLNGDQLGELNISSSISIPATEFRGTMQPDEYTTQKNRAAQPVAAAVNRVAAPAPARPASYTTGSYNTAARNYNSNVTMPTTSYTPRANVTPAYQTPRPPITTTRPAYPSYPSNTNYSSTPTVQQFQRPQVNGYNSYNSTTPQTSTQYPPRHTPNPAATFARVTSPTQPTQPTINGQPFRPSQYGQSSTQPSTQQYPNADSRAIMERLKAQQAVYQAQRQTSGTPHPPGYDGTSERTGTPNYEAQQQSQAVGS